VARFFHLLDVIDTSAEWPTYFPVLRPILPATTTNGPRMHDVIPTTCTSFPSRGATCASPISIPTNRNDVSCRPSFPGTVQEQDHRTAVVPTQRRPCATGGIRERSVGIRRGSREGFAATGTAPHAFSAPVKVGLPE
jgi:hypothetical protein